MQSPGRNGILLLPLPSGIKTMNKAQFDERISKRESGILQEKIMKRFPNSLSVLILIVVIVSFIQLRNSTIIVKNQYQTYETEISYIEPVSRNEKKIYRKMNPKQKKYIEENNLDESHNVSTSLSKPNKNALVSKRFPKYDTKEFSKRCSWIDSDNFKEDEESCFFMVKPNPLSSEGLSDWVSLVVIGHLLARQAGCGLILSFVPNVDILEVIIPQNFTVSKKDDLQTKSQVAWIPEPTNFDCNESSRCKRVISRGCAWRHNEAFGTKLAPVPIYREPYADRQRNESGSFRDLHQMLHGFDLESGMACSFESLIQLSPNTVKYEPKIFTDILPALHDEEALVISIYIRTGQTDKIAIQSDGSENKQLHQSEADHVLKCVLEVENKYLQENFEKSFGISHVVWMVVSDSQFVKEMVTNKYNDSLILNSTSHIAQARSAIGNLQKRNKMKRKVITTTSRGAHTRSRINPSTADFVEGMIDWYLIGESDVVVGKGPSFHVTGALRTARPFYKEQCKRPILFQ